MQQKNKLIIESILKEKSEAYWESFRAYQVWYPKVTFSMLIKGLLLPLKFMFTKIPDLVHATILVECFNLEKYKRIKSVIEGKGDVLIHVNEISTARPRYFYETVKEKRMFFRARMQGFWSALRFTNPFQGIHLFVFQLHLIQNLIHYQNLISRVSPKILASANEDFWFSPMLSELARKNGITTVNVMHGSVYNMKQFYDYSVVYGKKSKTATEKHASSYTKVILGKLAELNQGKEIQNEVYKKNIVLFDQATSYPFQKIVRPSIYEMLERLVREKGYHVVVKLHPSQSIPDNAAELPFDFILQKSVKEVIADRGIAIGMCSTVGLEVVSYGIPMVYINYDHILDLFLQLIFLEETAVKDVPAAEEKICELQDRTKYVEYVKQQRRLLDEEYAADQSQFLEIFDSKPVRIGLSSNHEF
jgi:hypothetical protein